jgi:hypothetical protein
VAGLAEDADLTVCDVECAFSETAAGLRVDVKRDGFDEETITERDAYGGDPSELIPGVACLMAADAVDVVEREQLVWVLGGLVGLTLAEVVGKGLGVDDPAAVSVKNHVGRRAALTGNASVYADGGRDLVGD